MDLLYRRWQALLTDRMNRGTMALVLSQTVLAGCALALSVWAQTPVVVLVGLGVLGLSALVATLAPAARREQYRRWSGRIAWGCTLLVLAGWVLSPKAGLAIAGCDYYCGEMAWLMAGTLLPVGVRVAGSPASVGWRVLLWLWAVLGTLLWLAGAYLESTCWAFYLGLLLAVGLLVGLKWWFRLPGAAILAANTLILLTLGLPVLDLFLHPPWRVAVAPEKLQPYYCYRTAKQNRAAFERWWNYYFAQFNQMVLQMVVQERGAEPFLRLRPNAQATLVRSHIATNSKGFRGREIALAKGAAYRIVALGESTTFGFTLAPEDKPWPELLEAKIRERLHPTRPVEVINAGIPAATLLDTLHRLPTEILPLQPDLMICYHGFNGFYLLDSALRPPRGRPFPSYRPRPLQVLADGEYRLRLMWYNHQTASAYRAQPAFTNVLENAYAQAYRQLIHIARTNQIRLVIATFPLAVNTNSPPDLVDFFRSRYPKVESQIRANVVHGQMVQQLARECPEVGLVDARPGLDGQEEKYLDLMHVTQQGDRLLAETFFAGISNILQQDLFGPVTKVAGP